MKNKKTGISKKYIDMRLHDLRHAIFNSKKAISELKPYREDQDVILVGFYYTNESNENVFITLDQLETKCKRRELLYRDIRYHIIHMTISEEHEYHYSQFGFVAFTNNNREMKPYFGYNQYPKIKNPEVPENKYSWKFLELSDYFLGEPVSSKQYYDIYYAILMVEISERIPKTIFKDIIQDLHDLF